MSKGVRIFFAVVTGMGVFMSQRSFGKEPTGLNSPVIGKPAPQFSLPNLDGQQIDLINYKGKYVVLEWTNFGCPFVLKHYNSNNMQNLQKEFTSKGVIWLSICSSASGKQGSINRNEWEKKIKEFKAQPTKVLLDHDGKVGRLYGAKTTPHMFIISPDGSLIYKGAIDDTPSMDMKDIPRSHNYIRSALEEGMAGKKISQPNTQPYGCSVKY